MYTESEFMDMSLSSRLDKLNQEINKMVDWRLRISESCFEISHNLNIHKYYTNLSIYFWIFHI
jgi:hypothetical protein